MGQKLSCEYKNFTTTLREILKQNYRTIMLLNIDANLLKYSKQFSILFLNNSIMNKQGLLKGYKDGLY